MGRSDLGHVNLEGRVLPDEGARGAGMVEVDVAEQEMANVRQLEAPVCKPLLERLHIGRRPAVEERKAVVRLEQVAADDPLGAEVVEVD